MLPAGLAVSGEGPWPTQEPTPISLASVTNDIGSVLLSDMGFITSLVSISPFTFAKAWSCVAVHTNSALSVKSVSGAVMGAWCGRNWLI